MRRALFAPLLLALAACNQTAPVPDAPAPRPGTLAVTPESFQMPQGSGCSGDIARWKAIQDNDLAMGHVSQTVYNQIAGEIGKAQSACAAGRDAEASGLIAASRKRHGYPS